MIDYEHWNDPNIVWLDDIKLIIGEFYWVKYYNEITIGQYVENPLPEFLLCGMDDIIRLNEVKVIEKVNRPNE